MREKIKYLKIGQSTYCHEGQVLHIWQDKRDVELISTLHTSKSAETEKKNQKGEILKNPEITEDYKKFM